MAAEKLSKDELIKEVVERSGVKAGEVLPVVQHLFETITDALCDGISVPIQKFGVFESNPTVARKGRNPATGDSIDIPASQQPKFRPSEGLRIEMKEAFKEREKD